MVNRYYVHFSQRDYNPTSQTILLRQTSTANNNNTNTPQQLGFAKNVKHNYLSKQQQGKVKKTSSIAQDDRIYKRHYISHNEK